MSNQKDLKIFLETKIIKKLKKLKGKHAPISEIANNTSKVLLVKSIYDLRENLKHFLLLNVKNYNKSPKFRYFLAISLANNSSDFLVQLASDFATKNDLKLIQYPIFPKTLRIQLLLLKEVKKIEDYSQSIKILEIYRDDFRKKLVKVKNLVQNK